jgi:dTDP-4-dehydrorhamnose 3,5-epimerase
MPALFTPGPLEGLVIIEPRFFPDERGFFAETYKASEYKAHGVGLDFVQDNHSKSSRGVLRGLHFQRPPHEQGKLVRVIEGAVWDVAVDLRPESPTYMKWYGIELSDANHLMLYIPPGFAHGFVTLSETAQFQYKCTAEYDKASEGGYRWNDPAFGIEWPLRDVIVSEKDGALPRFVDPIRTA